MKKLSIFSAALLGLLWPTPVLSDVTQDGDVEVTANVRGPMGLKIEAKSRAAKLRDDGTMTVVSLSATSLETGIRLRDEHMKKALEVDKFGTIKVSVKDSDLVIPGVDDSIGRDVPAEVELHGTKGKVMMRYDAVKDCEGHVGVVGVFTVKMDEFGVVPPSYAGVSVKNEVRVVARFRVKDS